MLAFEAVVLGSLGRAESEAENSYGLSACPMSIDCFSHLTEAQCGPCNALQGLLPI